MSNTSNLGGGGNTQKTFANYTAHQLSLVSDKDTRETYLKSKDGNKYYNVRGKLYKIAYRDVTFNDKEFTVVYMTLVSPDTQEVFFIDAYQNMYTTDNLMNKLCTLTKEDLGKDIKIFLGSVSNAIKDDKGNVINWEKRLDSNGNKIPRFDMKIFNGNESTYLRDLLWESSKEDNQCDHELMGDYKVLRKMAKKSRNGGGVNTFWKETVTNHLTTIGFKEVKREKDNYTEYNLLNEVVTESVKNNPISNLSETTSNNQVSEPAMANTADDELPF